MQSKIEERGGNKSFNLTEAQRALTRTWGEDVSLVLLKLGYFGSVLLGSGNGTCLLRQEVTLARCQQQGTGPSCIPWESTRGFPWEDGEAGLRGFVFLFRPPGLATATDGDRLGP